MYENGQAHTELPVPLDSSFQVIFPNHPLLLTGDTPVPYPSLWQLPQNKRLHLTGLLRSFPQSRGSDAAELTCVSQAPSPTVEVDHGPPEPVRCPPGQVQADGDVVELCVGHSGVFIGCGSNELENCDEPHALHVVHQPQQISCLGLKHKTKGNCFKCSLTLRLNSREAI